MNLDLAFHIASELVRLGVQEICLCAGARNSPLVSVFSERAPFQVYHFFEERSAAFFALGRIKSNGRPMAVVTTSGTAVAELLPATMEAHYSGLPLLLITADRPRRYRGTGAPQSVEQVGIFGPYVSVAVDWAAEDLCSSLSWDCESPAQINLCFEEPLLDRSITDEDRQRLLKVSATHGNSGRSVQEGFKKLDRFLESVHRPLVIISGGMKSRSEDFRQSIIRFLLQLECPVYLEATSELRECQELEALKILSSDRFLESLNTFKNPIDGVLRIGGVPTLRFWRDLEEKRADLPVLSISDCPFAGSTRSELIWTNLDQFFSQYELKLKDRFTQAGFSPFADLFEADRHSYQSLVELLEKEPDSECGLLHTLSRQIPERSRIYLGNSLPIREWDLASVRSDRGFVFAANRGANGIDGQVSSFLGFSEPEQENWAVLGDLTTMYDLVAPWILPQLSDRSIRLVVVNNGGGKIFSRMFKNPVFQNEHEVGFASLAALWKLNYECWGRIPDQLPPRRNTLIELRPDPRATARFWAAYDLLWQKA